MTEPFDGRYLLQRGIARITSGGGVYAAEHRFTHEPCAIKIFDANAPNIVRRRVAREMEALARAKGPGVVGFRDAGESNGHAFIVMDLLDGRTLDGLLAAKGKLPAADAIEITSRIAEALAHCHSRGVVHRDVKPHNVHVSPANEVRVLDFGIAKVTDEIMPLEKLTAENSLMGTPEYMAPEALIGARDADHRADQYSLGVTMFECITGTVPFEGSSGDVLAKVTAAKRTPLDAVQSEISAALLGWLARVLEHEPGKRFEDMSAAAKALGAIAARKRDVATIADSPHARRPATRRRFPRAAYASLARVARADSSYVDGRVEEISESGCQFVADRALRPLEEVKIRFALPLTGTIVELAAACRWARSTRVAMAMGFEFANVPEAATGEIRKYVRLMGGSDAQDASTSDAAIAQVGVR